MMIPLNPSCRTLSSSPREIPSSSNTTCSGKTFIKDWNLFYLSNKWLVIFQTRSPQRRCLKHPSPVSALPHLKLNWDNNILARNKWKPLNTGLSDNILFAVKKESWVYETKSAVNLLYKGTKQFVALVIILALIFCIFWNVRPLGDK